MNPVLMLGNPRKSGKVKKTRRGRYSVSMREYSPKKSGKLAFFKIKKNPRLSSGGMPSGVRSLGSLIIGNVLPLAGGFGAGLLIPRILPAGWSKTIKLAAVAGAGIAVPMLAGRFIGRKTAMLLGSGMLAAVVFRIVDEQFLSKTTGGPTLKDDETIDIFAESDPALSEQSEDPALSEQSEDPALSDDEDDGM